MLYDFSSAGLSSIYCLTPNLGQISELNLLSQGNTNKYKNPNLILTNSLSYGYAIFCVGLFSLKEKKD